MPIGVAVLLLVSLAAAGALLASGSRPRRTIALVLGATPLALPCFVVIDVRWPLFVFGVAAATHALRAIDLARASEPFPPLRRVWHALGLVDTRRTERIPPTFEGRRLARALGWSLVLAAGFTVGLFVANTQHGALHFALRWIGMSIFALASFEVAGPLLVVGHGLAGLRIPPPHDAPYLSKSIGEFWGARWNRIIGSWLRETCYLPLATRGHALLGLGAAFLVSAVMHAYIVAVSVGLRWALPMAAFFVAQLVLIIGERLLGVRRWPAPAARAWTIGAMLLVMPLFLESLLPLVDELVAPG